MHLCRPSALALFALLPFVSAQRAAAQATTTAGEFSVEPPTLVALGFDWQISGANNRTPRVDVSFRKKGDPEWRGGLPLLRLQREQVNGRVGGPRLNDAAPAAENAADDARQAPPPPAPAGGGGGRGGGENGPFAFSPFAYTAPN